jgi:acyl-CoA reductase-like NAD-dependent aldehyde dehydrogenase
MDSADSNISPFPRILAAHIQGRASPARFRQEQFKNLKQILVSHRDTLTYALTADNGFSYSEALFEFSLCLAELNGAYDTIDFAAELAANRAIETGDVCFVQRRGVGIVYIRLDSTCNSLYSALSPLCAALAAGNCIVLEVNTIALSDE